MDLQNSFTVPADIDTAWKTLLDVESIAPCMPGATLESVDGDEFTASVKVKLGPVSMTYNGEARFLAKTKPITPQSSKAPVKRPVGPGLQRHSSPLTW